MTIDAAREAEIRRLHFAEHWKVGTIVTQLGEHHDVVERVLGLGKGARRRPAIVPEDAIPPSAQVPEPLRAYETFVAETLAQYPRLRATRLYDMLVERGYEGSTRTVRRHVQIVRPAPSSNRTKTIACVPLARSRCRNGDSEGRSADRSWRRRPR